MRGYLVFDLYLFYLLCYFAFLAWIQVVLRLNLIQVHLNLAFILHQIVDKMISYTSLVWGARLSGSALLIRNFSGCASSQKLLESVSKDFSSEVSQSNHGSLHHLHNCLQIGQAQSLIFFSRVAVEIIV